MDIRSFETAAIEEMKSEFLHLLSRVKPLKSIHTEMADDLVATAWDLMKKIDQDLNPKNVWPKIWNCHPESDMHWIEKISKLQEISKSEDFRIAVVIHRQVLIQTLAMDGIIITPRTAAKIVDRYLSY